MKIHISILLLSFLTLKGFSQERFYEIMPMDNGRVVYSLIIDVDSLSKDIIYGKLKEWAVDHYGSQKAALQSEDKESGFIAYKGYMKAVGYGIGGLLNGKEMAYHLFHTLKFYVKDGKYRIVVDDIRTYNLTEERIIGSAEQHPIEDRGKGQKKKFYEKFKKDIASFDRSIDAMINSIVSAVKNKSSFDF